MHFGDSIFIFLLALVLFGPKKLPEIGRTIGKLLAEFRRASNEFKFQIQEELRNMEEDERRKKVAEIQAQKTGEIAVATETPAGSTTPTILPPSTGTPVSTDRALCDAWDGSRGECRTFGGRSGGRAHGSHRRRRASSETALETPAHLDLTADE